MKGHTCRYTETAIIIEEQESCRASLHVLSGIDRSLFGDEGAGYVGPPATGALQLTLVK